MLISSRDKLTERKTFETLCIFNIVRNTVYSIGTTFFLSAIGPDRGSLVTDFPRISRVRKHRPIRGDRPIPFRFDFLIVSHSPRVSIASGFSRDGSERRVGHRVPNKTKSLTLLHGFIKYRIFYTQINGFVSTDN